ncbi:hypothetical protein [Endozoicomonas atrinae]|uniref:hypothetical protein n=1 Tax=Endozoicomonas atrinae TaxID=1333660 RepID=UPI003B00C862
MARLRQQHPQNYTSSGNISVEFENVVRYLNAAELGNKTLSELLQSIFDTEGNFDSPVQMRYVQDAGVEYRIGEYTDAEEGWKLIVDAATLRGEPGISAGVIGESIYQARYTFVATADNEQTYDLAYDLASEDLLVYHNGILRGAPSHYTLNDNGGANGLGSITFIDPVLTDDQIDIFKIRIDVNPGFRREDVLTIAPQNLFTFIHDTNERVLVYRNGILQREGLGFDYVTNPDTNTVTFTETIPTNSLVTFLVVQDTTQVQVSGLMMEDKFVDPATGLITWSNIQADDDEIPQSKVFNLTNDLNKRAYMEVGALTPENPQTSWLWLDTSRTPNQLKFFDGLRWLATSPESTLPGFSGEVANQYVRVNGTGTGLEYADIDLSSVVPKTQKGAANGVASLDSQGRIPSGQMPEILSQSSLSTLVLTPEENTEIVLGRILRQKLRVDAAAFRLISGTCDVQITVNGVEVGQKYSVSSVPTEFPLSNQIEIDASLNSKSIALKVTNVNAANTLDAVLAVSNLTL